jgi:Condensation domain
MQTSLHPAERAYPLTRAQARLFFLHQLDTEARTYVFPVYLRLRGPLDTSALAAALAGIAERHEILRSTIEVREGVPRPGRAEPVHRAAGA